MYVSRNCHIAHTIFILLLLVIPSVALAHPMGNFSINHYTKIVPGERLIIIEYIIDMAEIPTFQEIQDSGILPRSADPSVVPYLLDQSQKLARGLTLELNGRQLQLETVLCKAIFPPGAGGLPTMKMHFLYRAAWQPTIAASLFSLHYVDSNFPGRAGWKEVIAVEGSDAIVVSSSVPSRGRSVELSNYPTDLIHSPPQTLVADLTFKSLPPGANQLTRQGGRLEVKLVANQQGTPRSIFTELITSNRADLAFLLVAALIAALLGGLHACEPGHAKTLVAAYLIGSRGTARHAVLLGSVVTASHTISVYLLGIVTLYLSQWIVPERLYPWLGALSGLLVALLGLTLFVRRLASSNWYSSDTHPYDHSHDNDSSVHSHRWWSGHVHHHSSLPEDYHEQSDHDGQGHHHAAHHDHDHAPSHINEKTLAAGAISLRSLFALGVTGGIVPCPAALVVLLGAVAIHRVAFGLFLIVAFSIGLAAVLVSFGLAMVYARSLMSRFQSDGPLIQRWLPLTSSAVITLIGVTIAIQSL